MTTTDELAFLQQLRRTDRAVVPLIVWHRHSHPSDDQLREHVEVSRQLTGDSITDFIAVYLAVMMVGAIGITPARDGRHGFMLHTVDGQPLDVDDAPAGIRARARMVTAIANGDPLAARDVFIAYRRTHDSETVTAFLADFIVEVSDEATARGITIRM